jgi:4-amino-4-deoxy-L-arabinose transferase-like glycosyltransferase
MPASQERRPPASVGPTLRGPRPAGFIAEHGLVLAVLALFVVAKAAIAASTYYLPAWDEAVYIGIGKYLYSGGTAGLFEAIRPPGLPLLTGALWRVGLDPLLWARVVSLLLAAVAVLLAYALARRLYSPLAGRLAAVLLVCAPLFFIWSGRIMTEIPSAVFLLLALWLLARGVDFLTGLSAGAALLIRFPQGVLVFAAVVLCLLGLVAGPRPTRRALLAQAVRFSGGVLLVVAPYLVATAFAYRTHAESWWGAALRPILLAGAHKDNPFESMTGHAGPVAAAFDYLARLGLQSPALLVGLAVGFVAAIAAIARRPSSREPAALDRSAQASRLLLTTLVLAGAYLASIANTQERFLLPILPLIAVVAGGGIASVASWCFAQRREPPRPMKAKSAPVAPPMARLLGGGVLAALVVGSMVLGALRAYEDYTRQPPAGAAPPIVAFYRSIDQFRARGARRIATSDPVLAAYTDHAMMPFYEATNPHTVFINDGDEWDTGVAKASLVLYAPSSYPCRRGMDWCTGREPALRARVFALGPVIRTFCAGDSVTCRYLVRPSR